MPKKFRIVDFASRPSHLVNRASRLVLRYGEALMQPLGLGVAAYPVLMLLRGGTEMTQRDLAACAKSEQPSMAQLLARLERGGMIRRRPDPNDGRASLIALTDQAEALMPELDRMATAANRAALSGFTAEESTQLIDLLQRMIANLEAAVT